MAVETISASPSQSALNNNEQLNAEAYLERMHIRYEPREGIVREGTVLDIMKGPCPFKNKVNEALQQHGIVGVVKLFPVLTEYFGIQFRVEQPVARYLLETSFADSSENREFLLRNTMSNPEKSIIEDHELSKKTLDILHKNMKEEQLETSVPKTPIKTNRADEDGADDVGIGNGVEKGKPVLAETDNTAAVPEGTVMSSIKFEENNSDTHTEPTQIYLDIVPVSAKAELQQLQQAAREELEPEIPKGVPSSPDIPIPQAKTASQETSVPKLVPSATVESEPKPAKLIIDESVMQADLRPQQLLSKKPKDQTDKPFIYQLPKEGENIVIHGEDHIGEIESPENKESDDAITTIEELMVALGSVDREKHGNLLSEDFVGEDVKNDYTKDEKQGRHLLTVVVSEEILDIVNIFTQETDFLLEQRKQNRELCDRPVEQDDIRENDRIMAATKDDKKIILSSSENCKEGAEETEFTPMTTFAELEDALDYMSELMNISLHDRLNKDTKYDKAISETEIIISEEMMGFVEFIQGEAFFSVQSEENQAAIDPWTITFSTEDKTRNPLTVDGEQLLRMRKLLIDCNMFANINSQNESGMLSDDSQSVSKAVTEFIPLAKNLVTIFGHRNSVNQEQKEQIENIIQDIPIDKYAERNQCVLLVANSREIRIEIAKLRKAMKLYIKREYINSGIIFNQNGQAPEEIIQNNRVPITNRHNLSSWFRCQLLFYLISLLEERLADYVLHQNRNVPPSKLETSAF